MADVQMRILLSAVGGGAVTQALSGIASSITGGGGLNAALLGVGVAAGAAAIGLGVAAVSASSQFQQAMLNNEAHAGLAASQVNNVTNALLQMGPAVGQGPTQLAQALYPILSGFSGISDQSAKTTVSLAELKDAAESVAGTTTSVTVVSNAATAAFNAYGLATNDAATNTDRMNNLFDVMNATVSAGNMQWADYANVIGKLSVSSRASGVSFNEANAALADLTNQGYSAQLASTYLGNTFTDLYLKTGTTAKNAKSLGLSFDETKYKGMDLAGKISYLNQVTGGNQSELLKLLGGNSVALKTFDALSNSIGTYKGNLQSLGSAQGTTASDFQTASQGFGFSMQKLQAFGQSLLITLGTNLLPVLTNIINWAITGATNFSNWATHCQPLQSIMHSLGTGFSDLGKIVGQITNWFQHNAAAMDALKVVGIAFAGAFIALLVAGFIALGIAAFSAAAGVIAATWPILAIGAGIALLIAIVTLLVTHWTQVWGAIKSVAIAVFNAVLGALVGFATWVGNIFGGIKSFFQTWGLTILEFLIGPVGIIIHFWQPLTQFFSGLWNDIKNVFSVVETMFSQWFGNAYNTVVNLWNNLPGIFRNLWNGIVNDTKNIFGTISSAIGGILKGAINLVIIDPINGIISGIDAIHVNTPFGSIGFSIPKIPQLASGGTVLAPGLAWVGERGPELLSLPQGAMVSPLSNGTTGAGAGPVYNFYISVSTLARTQSDVRNLVDMIEQELGRRFRTTTPGFSTGGVF